MKNIGYHTRLDGNNTQKICGGSFGGSIDSETIERLVKAHFTVTVKPSGHPVFVDKAGREVTLYLTVDPAKTSAGEVALKVYRAERAKVLAAEAAREKELQAEIDDLMDGLSHEHV